MRDDAQYDPQGNPGNMEKDALEGVEANKPALVVRLHDQKDDRRNYRDVGQHASHVISQPARRRGSRPCRRSSRAATGRTNRRTIWCLSPTYRAKSHDFPPQALVLTTTRERAHVTRNEPSRQTKSKKKKTLP